MGCILILCINNVEKTIICFNSHGKFKKSLTEHE